VKGGRSEEGTVFPSSAVTYEHENWRGAKRSDRYFLNDFVLILFYFFKIAQKLLN
jgi:hypothetical protein